MVFEKYIIVTNDEKECYKVSGSFAPLTEINKVFRNGWDTEEDAKFALTVITREWEQELVYEQGLYNEWTEKFLKNRITKAETNIKKLRKAKIIKVKNTYEFVR